MSLIPIAVHGSKAYPQGLGIERHDRVLHNAHSSGLEPNPSREPATHRRPRSALRSHLHEGRREHVPPERSL